MRTIKFRGKQIDNGKWVYGYLYKLPLENENVCIILTTDNIHKDNSIEPQYHLAFTLWKDLFVVDSSTLGQYTGLKDKNGKEIYEGDIVKCNEFVYKVMFEEKRFASFGLCRKEDMFMHYFGEAMESQQCEVIGNIYDNSQLINK